MSLIRRHMAPRSTRQTGSQRKLGGNARSFLSRGPPPHFVKDIEALEKVQKLIIIIIRYINLYSEPGIEATACARELLYVYVYV